VRYTPIVVAVLLVALVARSQHALTASTWVGIGLGALVLLAIGRRGQPPARPRPLTRLEIVRARYARGEITLDEFEAQVSALLAHGRAEVPVDTLLLLDE
jgi:Short C-terminal domain